jgi:dUTPase
MKFMPLHKNFKAPIYATKGSAAFDIHCTEDVVISTTPRTVKLGFPLQYQKVTLGC